MPKVGDKGPGGKVWAGDDFGWQNPQTVWKGQKPGSKAGETRTLPGLGTKVWTGKDYGWQSQATIDKNKKGAPKPEPAKPSTPATPSTPTARPEPSSPSSSSFTWNPNKNIIAAKGGKLGIMDKGDPKSWREPSEQEKGEIPISSTNAFRNSPAGQAFIKQKEASKGTSSTSSASASTADKIKGGLETYKAQVKSGNIKGAEATGKSTWELANQKLAAAAAERERTRGTSATTNPLMKDMKSKLPAPKPQTIKSSFEYDAFDLVIEYLLSNGHVDTVNEALYVMMEMDGEFIQSIVENVSNEPKLKPGSGLGGGKPTYEKGKEPKATGAKLPTLPSA